jgi:ribosomal protein S26
MYAGAKWAKGCHPDEFMQVNGYTTSSPLINPIIEQEGLYSFEVLRIDTNLDGLSAYEYESLFLQTIDCANSDDWYNGHNNSGMAFGLPQFYEKSRETCLSNHEVHYPMQSADIRHKSSQSKLEKHGDANYNNYNQTKTTNTEKYGVECVFQSEAIKQKSKQTKFEKYGNDTFSNPEQSKKTKLEKYGDTKYNNSEQANKTKLEKYGKDGLSKHLTDSIFGIHGVENASQIPFLSLIHNKKTYAKNIISRCFPEFKQYY